MFIENRQCGEHYDTTAYVADNGGIAVCLPFKSEARPLNNFHTVKQRLFALERKLKDHDDVKQQYREFIKELVEICLLEQTPQTSGLCIYLPYHYVFCGMLVPSTVAHGSVSRSRLMLPNSE